MGSHVHGKVQNGRLRVDEAVDLPDGASVQLVIVDAEDGLEDDDRARLHAALDDAHEELERGEGLPVDKAIAEARSSLLK